jgi:hypothetical protein
MPLCSASSTEPDRPHEHQRRRRRITQPALAGGVEQRGHRALDVADGSGQHGQKRGHGLVQDGYMNALTDGYGTGNGHR